MPQQNIVTIRGGKARSQFVGGNLTVLTALAGSPYLPDFTSKILFLGTWAGAYRIDRMFNRSS